MQDLIDQQMQDTKQKPVMQLVMGGKFAQQIICKGLPYKSEKEEDFYQVRPASNVAAAFYCLDKTWQVEMIRGHSLPPTDAVKGAG